MLMSCSADVPASEVGVSPAMRYLAKQKIPFDGRLYSKSSGRIVIDLDTPLCSAREGLGRFSLESSDFLEPLDQPAVVDGGDRQIAEEDDRCRRKDAVHFYGLSESRPYDRGQKIFLFAWQGDAFWAGWIRRPVGDFGDFTKMQWLTHEEQSRRSFRKDCRQIGQAFGIFLAND
jgi:hypothetical protein